MSSPAEQFDSQVFQSFSDEEIHNIRSDFETLQTKVHGKDLIYFDNGATTLKPKSVIEKIDKYYKNETANIHRGIHFLSEKGTTDYENSRTKIKDFINAKDRAEVIFTKGTTESINLVALSYGRKFLEEGDEIIISTMEHHSNIVPWQLLCQEKGCKLKVIPINDDGEIIFDEYLKLLNHNTKIVSVNHISNTLGTINPIKKIIDTAHEYNAVVLIDGAQAIAHTPVDVQALNCDFYAFSAHKMFGPTGIGVLYGKAEILNSMPPVFGGGDMIDQVTFEKTTYNTLPHKFEAGTPHIAGGIAFGATIDYINEIGLDRIHAYESMLLDYATKKILEVKNLRIIGTAKNKSAILSFFIDGAHPHDIATLLDMDGIAVRTGHHCTQPLMERFQVPATVRASFSLYNTTEEIDFFIKSLIKVKGML